MKTIPLFLLGILCITCEPTSNNLLQPSPPSDEIRLKLGETITLENGSVSITFTSLSEDSRCPEGAVCIWAGNAKVRIEVMKNEIDLNTELQPKEKVIGGYTIRLLEVSPYPKLGEQPLPEEYSIRITVKKEE